MSKIPGIVASAAATLFTLTNPQSVLAENQKQSPILLAKSKVKAEVVSTLATTRAKQELESLWVELEPKKQKVDDDAFDEANFKLDLEEYLGDDAKLFAEMPKDKKNIFANTLTQLLRDNGKTIELDFWDWPEKFNTLDEIQYLMQEYVWFLNNIDTKRQPAISLYENVLNNFQEYIEQWVIVDDSIMYTLYWMKIFAEEVDFYRDEILWKPGQPSEKYAKHSELMKKRIEKLEKSKAELEKSKAELEKSKAELEVLKLVTKWLEAMSRVK